MTFPPPGKGYLPPEKKDKNAVTPARIAIWVVVGGIGVWMIGSGVIGIVNGG